MYLASKMWQSTRPLAASEEIMNDNTNELLKIHKALENAIKTAVNGQYDKLENEYFFEFNGESEFIASVQEDTIDFKLVTMKWVPGNYEPLLGSELYLRISMKELSGLTEEEIFKSLLLSIGKLEKN